MGIPEPRIVGRVTVRIPALFLLFFNHINSLLRGIQQLLITLIFTLMRKKVLRFALFLMAALWIPMLSACGDDEPTPADTVEDTTTGQTNNDNGTNNGSNGNDDNGTNSDDEDANTTFKRLILGTWEGCVSTLDNIMCTITFKSNGTFSEVDAFYGDTVDSDGTYTIEDNILTLEGDYSQLINANAFTFVIVECTSEHLVLTPFYAKNDFQIYYDNITLTRK
jgi:hypothetical protein